ncbi:MAG: PqiC family protein [Verrucomicrobiota bacterium]|nr:MAG: PqiC family protein [Verrucomicrobiota bacterium]
MTRVSIVPLILFLAGCQILEPKPDETRLFLIAPRIPEVSAPAINQATVRISIRHFPKHLESPYFIEQLGPNELKELPKYRWAVPLEESILDLLRRYIRNSFPRVAVEIFPRDSAQDADHAIRIDVEELAIDIRNQRISFTGEWEFYNLKQKSSDRSPFEFHMPLPASSDRYASIAAQIEQAMIALCLSIVQKMDLLLLKSESETNAP